MTMNMHQAPEKVSPLKPLSKSFSAAFGHGLSSIHAAQPAETLPPHIDICKESVKKLAKDFMRDLRKVFAQKSTPYNAKQPYVLVDLGPSNPVRGDSHGYRGIATRLAQKTGARLKVIDYNDLIDETPDLQSIMNKDWDVRIQHRRRAFFDKEGYPDFLFTRFPGDSADYLAAKGASGVIIKAFNEEIPGKLGGDTFEKSPARIPHHLTPEDFAHEGRRFAEEYAELPRPFIGVNLIDHQSHKPGVLAGKLAEVASAYPAATIFICTCHRTSEYGYDRFMNDLKKGMADLGADFHVVEFKYNDHIGREGQYGFWNPYKGMLDQADHLVQCGYSGSMVSESLSTGKVPYTTDAGEYWSDMCIRQGNLVNLFEQQAGKPLPLQTITPPDVTGECADKIAVLLARHKEIHNSVATQRDIRNGSPADGDWGRYAAHKKAYYTLG